jgi:hypothetical protein
VTAPRGVLAGRLDGLVFIATWSARSINGSSRHTSRRVPPWGTPIIPAHPHPTPVVSPSRLSNYALRQVWRLVPIVGFGFD